MEIKILGSGCSSCTMLYETTKQAIAEMGVDATVVKEEDIMKILEYNVMRTPAMVIDEKLVSAGRKLSLQEVKSILAENSK